MIDRYMQKLDKEMVNNFAVSKNMNLNDNELNFLYSFVKKNWQPIIANHGRFEINHLKEYFSDENFKKLVKTYKEYLTQYGYYL